MDAPREILRRQAELLREVGPAERLRRSLAWSRELLHASRIRAIKVGAAEGLDEHDALERWIRQQYGINPSGRGSRRSVGGSSDPGRVSVPEAALVEA